MDAASANLSLLLLMGTMIVVWIYGSSFMLRSAVRNVVTLFRERGATSSAKTLTLEELGLVKRPMDRGFRRRDYRPYALQVLGDANIVRVTEEGRLYLSEEELNRWPLKSYVGIK